MFLFSVSIYYETLLSTTDCDHASKGDDSSSHEIYHSKDADIPIDGISSDFNKDQVSISRIQLDKPSPTDSYGLSEQC